MVVIQIYKNGVFVKECETIQETGHWLKEYTGDSFLRFTRIERGYCYGIPWDFKGARYKFVASESDSKRRRQELEMKKQ